MSVFIPLSLQRMKKTTVYIFTFLIAALVFYGGAGVNIISYCCDDCQTEGVEVVMDDKCCEVHGHSHEEGQAVVETADASCHPDERCCDLKRVDFDWNRGHSFQVSLHPVQLDLFLPAMPDLSFVNLPVVSEITSVMPTGPPPLCPRSYLSLLTVLLI